MRRPETLLCASDPLWNVDTMVRADRVLQLGHDMLNVVSYYRIARWFHDRSIPLVPVAITYFIRVVFGAWLPATARLGSNVKLGYGGLGVVIHAHAQIGNNVLIAQNVTLAGKRGGVPVIEDNVYIGAGAKILGNVKVGSGSIIGANAVVVKDVPPRCMVVGVPARIIRQDIEISDYEEI
jgi:serine O-acetyltransferase